MCDDHDHAPAAGAGPLARPAASRRGFLRGAAALGGIAAWSVPTSLRPARAVAAASTSATPVTMAMHVHASFSEGRASMGSQLQCARESDVDVVWFTEHDWRMSHSLYRSQVSFDSATAETQFGKPWTWRPSITGHPVSTSGGFVDSPSSPSDPSSTPGSLRITLQAQSTSAFDQYVWYADSTPSSLNRVGNIAGLTLELDVLAASTGPDAYGELRLQLSNHPASGGRAAGTYVVSYRFGAPGTRRAVGFTGIVPVAVPAGAWRTVTLDPVADIRALWPDLVAEDNSLPGMWLGAAARRSATADVVFDNLRMRWPTPAQLSPFDVQRSILASYASLYADVAAICAQEVSFLPEHMNWFGGDDYLMPYSAQTLGASRDSAATDRRARALAARGGSLSINHPFGAVEGSSAHGPTVAALATRYLKYGAYAATMLEVGYAQRGADLAAHLALWDVMSRNGVYLTGTGVNDNHGGLGTRPAAWDLDVNRFTTSVFPTSLAQGDLLAQLNAGRAFTSECTQRGLGLDLHADGVPMGSVSVRPDLDSRVVTVDTRGLPAGATLSLVQGVVDYAGAADPSAGSVVVASVDGPELSSGPVLRTVSTTRSSFVRATVQDGDGRTVAISNPVWLLRERSRTPVPAARVAADSLA